MGVELTHGRHPILRVRRANHSNTPPPYCVTLCQIFKFNINVCSHKRSYIWSQLVIRWNH